jgi:hypothetical protein
MSPSKSNTKRSRSPGSSRSPGRTRRLQFRDNEITEQKSCVSGPRVQFSQKGQRRTLRIAAYLTNLLKPGSLGCPEHQFPKYDAKSGKYCCSTTHSTSQELLDYINTILEQAFQNTGPSFFKSQVKLISHLLSVRKKLLKDPGVVDTIELPRPYTDVNVLFFDRWTESAELNNDPRRLPPDMKLPTYQFMPFQERLHTAMERGQSAKATFESPTTTRKRQRTAL